MNANEILQQNITKTRKIELLLGLGLTRKEVAALMGVGYGFVQNVYAKCYPERIHRRILDGPVSFTFAFTRSFGIELEMFGIERSRLVAGLREEGIAVEAESYNHITRAHWKIVNDGSVCGEHALELVSPILHGDAGLAEVQKVCKILKRLGARINKTAGAHVHCGMDDIGEDIAIWRNLFHNYATLEPLIDSFMPASRRASNNTY